MKKSKKNKKVYNMKDMEIGLDLTKLRTDEYVMIKTIEYIKGNKYCD